MKIGKLTLKLGNPSLAELESQLLASTGCSAAEVREQLRTCPIPSGVAAALLPFLAEPLHKHTLAVAIKAEGIGKVRDAVRELYEKVLSDKSAK